MMKHLRLLYAVIIAALFAVLSIALPPGARIGKPYPALHPIALEGIGVTARGALVPVRAQGFVLDNLNTIGLVGVGGTASVTVSFLDGNGHTLNIGTAESFTISVTTTAHSLPQWLAGSSKVIPSGSEGAILRVISGTVAMNRNGTADGSAGGAGNGFAASGNVPSSSSPEQLAAGQLVVLGNWSNAKYITLGGSLGTVTISGTVPISAATLPLPTGAATSANQSSIITLLGGGLPAALDGSGFLKTHEQGTVTVATHAVTGSGNFNVIGTGSAGSAATGVVTIQGIASMTAVKVDGSAVTQPVSGTVTANAGTGTMAVSAASLPLPTGASTSSNQTAVQSSPGSSASTAVTIQGSASGVAVPMSAASLPLPSGASTAAKQPALGTAGSASSDVLTVQGIASMTALKVDGSAVTQPVSLASLPALASGSNTIGSIKLLPGGTGWTPYFANAVKTTVTVSGSAGTFGGGMLINTDSAPVYLQCFDTTGAVTLGSTTPTFVITVPANSTAANGAAFTWNITLGVHLANGLKVAATTTPTGSSTSTNGLTGTLLYN